MKKSFLLVFFIVTSLITWGQVPGTISYQGYLTKANGSPVDDGPHTVKFDFYDLSDVLKMSKGPIDVTTDKGLFTTIIGSGVGNNAAFTPNQWINPLTVKITVDGVPLSSKVTLASVPYAIVAGSVGAANVVGTLAAANIPNLDGGKITTGVVSGSLVGTGINATNISSGTISNSMLDSDLQDLAADGIITNLSVNGSASIVATNGIEIGNNSTASGNYSVSIGSYANTGAAANGTIILGDRSVASATNGTIANKLYARFDNGYTFFTKSDLSTFVTIANGGNSWVSSCDSTKKENFKSINGSQMLSKIKKLKLGTWNYKTVGSQSRHYGPYAQEFFNAFGKDELGMIGNDTTIATMDIAGVNLTAIQALVNRTDELTETQQKLKHALELLDKKIYEVSLLKEELTKATMNIENQKRFFSEELKQMHTEIQAMALKQ